MLSDIEAEAGKFFEEDLRVDVVRFAKELKHYPLLLCQILEELVNECWIGNVKGRTENVENSDC